MAKAKILGALLIVAAIITFIANFGPLIVPSFGLWHNWLISSLLNLHWLWNPLSLLTPYLTGNIPIISGGIGWILNGIFTVLWPIILFIIGLILEK